MLPAIEARNLSKWGLCRRRQALTLPITVVCTFDVCRLNLAAMVDDSSGWINKGLKGSH